MDDLKTLLANPKAQILAFGGALLLLGALGWGIGWAAHGLFERASEPPAETSAATSPALAARAHSNQRVAADVHTRAHARSYTARRGMGIRTIRGRIVKSLSPALPGEVAARRCRVEGIRPGSGPTQPLTLA